MDKGKSIDASNRRAKNRSNTCNSMGANDSMGKGISMDASTSMYISNGRFTINKKDASKSREVNNEVIENICLFKGTVQRDGSGRK